MSSYPSARAEVVQKWEGVVTLVGDETFLADLVTISGDEADMIAEIYLEKVHEEDRPLVEPGAIFYWSIGQVKVTNESYSIIRFRRLPPWTAYQIERAKRRGRNKQRMVSDDNNRHDSNR